MKTYRFTKSNGWWFITLPLALKEYNETDFTCVEKAGGALDELAGGEEKLCLRVDVKPLKQAAVLELQALPATKVVEGYYRLRNMQGVLLKDHLPLCDLSLLLYGELPNRIYLRKK